MLLCSDHLELIQKPNLSHQQCHQSKSKVPGALCWKSFPRYRPDSSNLRWRSLPEAEAWVVRSGGETLSKSKEKMAFHSCTSSRPWLNHLIKAWSSPQLPSNPHLPQKRCPEAVGHKEKSPPRNCFQGLPKEELTPTLKTSPLHPFSAHLQGLDVLETVPRGWYLAAVSISKTHDVHIQPPRHGSAWTEAKGKSQSAELCNVVTL